MSGLGQCGIGAPMVKESQVALAINELERATARLAMVKTNLIQGLTPVLRQEPEKNEAGCCETARTSNYTPLAGTISSFVDSISDTANALEDALRRLEL